MWLHVGYTDVKKPYLSLL